MATPIETVFERLRSIVSADEERTQRVRRAAESLRDARAYRWVGLYDVTPTEVIAVAWTGAIAPAFPRFPVSQGLNGAAVRSGRPVIVQDVTADPRYLTTFGSTKAEAIFPIVSPATGQVIGTIDVESERINAFTAEDNLFLQACADLQLPLWLP